jgi:hypothetical protein
LRYLNKYGFRRFCELRIGHTVPKERAHQWPEELAKGAKNRVFNARCHVDPSGREKVDRQGGNHLFLLICLLVPTSDPRRQLGPEEVYIMNKVIT